MMDDLQTRNNIIAKARQKYIPGQTTNISKALELYLENEPKIQIPLVITKETKPQNIADMIGRPDCPDCGQRLMLRIINTPRGKANIKGWKTCWECLNCGYEKYSKETVKELINKGPVVEEENKID